MPLQRIYFYLLFTGVLTTIAMLASSTSTRQALDGCQDTCGDVTIPYPFGIGEDCYHDKQFNVTCNTTFNPPKLFLRASRINITNISLDGELNILKSIARECYDQRGSSRDRFLPQFNLVDFKVSYTRNKFMAIGCDTYATITGNYGEETRDYTCGCMSVCNNIDYVDNSSCSGIGCCQTPIPRGVDNFDLHLDSWLNHTRVWEFSPCSYAFVVEENKFNFSASSFLDLKSVTKLPMVLDWAIGNETCEVAKSLQNYVCGEHSNCYNATNGPGYLCRCSDGYQGNPYLSDGCEDINECGDPKLNVCEKMCKNTPGNYSCSCPKGYHGDGRKSGSGCVADQSPLIKIFLATAIGVIISLLLISWVYLWFKKKKLIEMKEMFFKQNGGLLLQKQLSDLGKKSAARIYSSEELEKATNSYADSEIIGKGGFGTVYKGKLTDGTIVAIKKSKMIDRSQMEQFVNEVVVLSQIHLKNVVQLLGCCLDTQVPLLVYEFIPNGTLDDHLHSTQTSLTWALRLSIAAETAGVLSYLHSSHAVPIIHRDIKPTNILLDDEFSAKVADFGSSRLVPLDVTQLSTMVQGTLGYLDPEYLQTSQLTEKSDVYSFGVVLVELLTGRKILSFDKHNNVMNNLAMYFIASLKEDRLFQIIDGSIVCEASAEQLKEIAYLAKRCLSLKGEDRPTMKEVAMELEGLRVMTQHPWVNSSDPEEVEHLINAPMIGYGMEGRTDLETGWSCTTEIVAFELDDGR